MKSNDKIQELEIELKQLKQRLQDTEKAFVHRERLASLGELVPGISHEINTPLGVAVSAGSFLESVHHKSVKLFEEGKLKKSDLVEYFTNVQESSEIINKNLFRAVELIKNLKEISVYQSSDIKVRFDLCQYINTIFSTLKHEYKHSNHQVIVACDGISVYSHPGVFSQIITNLAMNSLHHGFKDLKDGVVKVTVNLNENNLIFKYSDNGHGIEKNSLEHIFDAFYTTSRDTGGSGLGLSIVKQLVNKKLKGDICCRSEVNEGVEFTITIPRTEIEKG
ncbi:MAG: HAMP domain-containing histidine kinase [Clostridiales bacterium]|nr:HAMP domain-containing histidine kinase [Clostridiales bacterium]